MRCQANKQAPTPGSPANKRSKKGLFPFRRYVPVSFLSYVSHGMLAHQLPVPMLWLSSSLIPWPWCWTYVRPYHRT